MANSSESVGGVHVCCLESATGKLLTRELLDTVRGGSQNGQYYGYIPSSATMLDRTWHFMTASERFNVQWKDGLLGQIVVFDKTTVVARQLKTINKKQVAVITAQPRPTKPGEKVQPLWTVELPDDKDASAITLAGDYALVGTASADGKQGTLLVLSMKDGSKISESDLPSPAASDGLAIVDNRLYVATAIGQLLCFQ